MNSRSSRLPMALIVGESRSTSLSLRKPSGVSSKAHAETTAGMKPTARTITTPRMTASDRPKTGNRVSATWITSQLTAT